MEKFNFRLKFFEVKLKCSLVVRDSLKRAKELLVPYVIAPNWLDARLDGNARVLSRVKLFVFANARTFLLVSPSDVYASPSKSRYLNVMPTHMMSLCSILSSNARAKLVSTDVVFRFVRVNLRFDKKQKQLFFYLQDT